MVEYNFKADPSENTISQAESAPEINRNQKRNLTSEEKLNSIKGIIFLIGAIIIGFFVYSSNPIASDLGAGSKIAYNLLYIAISCGLAAILVTDFCIRFFLSSILAALIALFAVGFAKLLHLSPTALWWTGFIVGVLSLCGSYLALAQTSWIGLLCSSCSKRGKISERIIDKDYMFTDHRRTSVGIRPFAVYKVTHEKSCGYCGATWTWQTEESSERK